MPPRSESQYLGNEFEPPWNQPQLSKNDNQPGVKRPRLSLSLKRKKKESPGQLPPPIDCEQQEHLMPQMVASMRETEQHARQPLKQPSLEGSDDGQSFRHSLFLMELALTKSLFPYVHKLSTREIDK